MLSFFRAMDELVASHLTPHTPRVRIFWTRVTHLGGTYFITAIGFCSVMLFVITGLYEFALGLIVALGGSMAFAFALKELLMRERPLNPLVTEKGHALPSGHTTASLALYGYLGYVFVKLLPSLFSLFIVAILAFLILAIGFSRIYVRAHHASDVLLGYFIGTIFLVFAIAIS